MGIGLGIILLVVGLIFALGAVSIDAINDHVATETLGWILVGVGVLAIVLALVMNHQRGQTRHVEEHRIE